MEETRSLRLWRPIPKEELSASTHPPTQSKSRLPTPSDESLHGRPNVCKAGTATRRNPISVSSEGRWDRSANSMHRSHRPYSELWEIRYFATKRQLAMSDDRGGNERRFVDLSRRRACEAVTPTTHRHQLCALDRCRSELVVFTTVD